ncbi:hypothetical protein [Fusobacterium gastrosuis]|uniref:hypothetical protein n=1 Tax=Fusobacterium gastrosuis TaxID=1755100 RepID=UPI00297A7787|nr:hypothetical protein [Fusobacteriaceae bacterium]MDY5714296.1 hypothetical protein [Fusobacterium gastrosuis]
MKIIFRFTLVIALLFILLGCNKNSPKPLETKFIGTYIDDSWEKVKEVAELNLSGKTLFITYSHINSRAIEGKTIIDEKITIEIENALFNFDKENNKYILNEETIKNVKATKFQIVNLYKNTTVENTYNTYKEFKEKTNSDGIAVEIKVNDTRKEILLDIYGTGAYSNFISFIEGYKQ